MAVGSTAQTFHSLRYSERLSRLRSTLGLTGCDYRAVEINNRWHHLFIRWKMPFPNEETQFKPGQSGNPHGRPKKATPITDRFVELLHKANGEKLQAIAESWMDQAIEGDMIAIKEALNRVEGKPPESVSEEDGTQRARFKLKNLDQAEVDEFRRLLRKMV